MAYENLKPTDKERLAAAFKNIKDIKSAMAKVNWEDATHAFKPDGTITGDSFKTSISRMKGGYSSLSPSDKDRLAASFCSFQGSDAYKAVMSNINWNKATTEFNPTGKPITAASFKTSIQRMLKDKNGGGRTGNTQVSKRKASSASASYGNLKKKSKTARDTDKARLSPDGDGETDKEDKHSLAGSNKGSLSPLVKDGDEDEDDAHLDNELFPEEPNFFA